MWILLAPYCIVLIIWRHLFASSDLSSVRVCGYPQKFKATNSDDGVNGLASIAANCEGEGVSDMAQRGKVSCAAVVDDAAEQASAEAATFLEHDMWPTSDALTSGEL
jgi:hypothetical protein